MPRTLSRVGLLLTLVVGFSLLVIPVANAYIDPGTGSMVFQAVIAGAMAAALSVKLFWRRITSAFRSKGSREHTGTGRDGAEQAKESEPRP